MYLLILYLFSALGTLGFILFGLGSFLSISALIYLVANYFKVRNPYIDFKG